MKLLVTGGAGFIGSHFVDYVLRNELAKSITILDSLTYAGSLENLSTSLPHVNFVESSINDSGVVKELVGQVDVVVNFAAESHNDNSLLNPKLFFETNLIGTLNLLEACRIHDKRFHHVSTDEVFGDLPLVSQEKFNRSSPYKPSSPYSASKAASDHAVRAWVRSYGVYATISNCTNNYGIRQHAEKLIPRTTLLALRGDKPVVYGDGLNSRDWIHVSDHVTGVWKAIVSGQPGSTYLFSAENNRSNVEVVQKILEIVGRDTSDYVFVRDRPGHDRRYSLDPSETCHELNWEPQFKDILDNLETIVDWYGARAVEM